EFGLVPAAKLVAAPKLPVPLPSRIDTLLETWLATARSGLPSLLKSPTATERGCVPAAKLVAAPKPTEPHPTEGAACETGGAGGAVVDPAKAEALNKARPTSRATRVSVTNPITGSKYRRILGMLGMLCLVGLFKLRGASGACSFPNIAGTPS